MNVYFSFDDQFVHVKPDFMVIFCKCFKTTWYRCHFSCFISIYLLGSRFLKDLPCKCSHESNSWQYGHRLFCCEREIILYVQTEKLIYTTYRPRCMYLYKNQCVLKALCPQNLAMDVSLHYTRVL